MNVRPLLACLPAVLLAMAACEGSPPSGRSVVLVTIDTARADAFGPYGRAGARTPQFDRWAREGALARWTIADAPITLPSHTTMLTGLPTIAHGVRTNVHHRLAGEAETLAEVFGRAGYETGAVVSTRVLAAETGIAQGFDHYDDELASEDVMQDPSRYPPSPDWLPPVARRADEAVDRAAAWLDRRGGKPFFLWLHLFDPHSVYDPPSPWDRAERDLYRAEVDWTDSQLRRLERAMVRHGLDDVVLLVVADHGEGRDDHREEEHGLFLYDEIVRVPMLVRAPRVTAGRVLNEQVRTMDLASTLLELAGRPERLGLGGSLVPALRGEGPVPSDVAYAGAMRPRVSHSGAPVKMLRTRERKFVWAPAPELYDLDRDPGERGNLLPARPDEADVWRERLASWIADAQDRTDPIAEPATPDADDLAALRSLGYTAGRGGTSPEPGDEMSVDGLDPKDFIDVAMAGRDLEMGWIDRAAAKLQRFLADDPDPKARPELRPLVATAHQNLGLVAMKRGEFAAAAEYYGRALAVSPDLAAAREGVVRALNLAGRSAEALESVDGFLLVAPSDERLQLHRAFTLLLLDRRPPASAAADRLAREGRRPDVVPVAEMLRDELAAPGTPPVLELYLSPR